MKIVNILYNNMLDVLQKSFAKKNALFFTLFSSKRNIFEIFTYNRVELRNAKVNSYAKMGGRFVTAHYVNSNDILLNPSGNRPKAFIDLGKRSGSAVLFLMYNNFLSETMPRSIKNAIDANNSTVHSTSHPTLNGSEAKSSNAKSSEANIINQRDPRTKTQILSSVMYDAWRFFKMTGASFSECLVRAWRNYNLVKLMLKGIVHFYFQKVDGTIREAWGTLYNNVLPETAHNRKKNDFVRVYFDTEKQEWRSFKKFNLINIM